MKPTLSKVHLPDPSDEYFVHLISNLLFTLKCRQIIENNEESLVSKSGAYSGRLRYMFFDQGLVDILWSRLKPFYD